jgi:hypothetical protein
MSTSTINSKVSDADFSDSTIGQIRPITGSMEQKSRPFVRPRTAPDLIAQHPELVANLMASLNPTHDVALFQSAVADIQHAAADGILTNAEAALLIGAVIEGFAARRAAESVSSAVQSVFSSASK